MKIIPKVKIGDEAWVLVDEVIRKVQIRRIITTETLVTANNKEKTSMSIVDIRYECNLLNKLKGSNLTAVGKSDKEVFLDKEDLMDALTEKI